MARLKEIFEKKISPSLMTKLNYKNKHQVPKIVKIILKGLIRKIINYEGQLTSLSKS